MKDNSKNQIFVDRFFVPAPAKTEFINRMEINRSFIKTLEGFIKDEAYVSTDENGNLTCITLATWDTENALDKAKEAVQAEYKKQGFNPTEMMERLKIKMERGTFKKL